MNTSTIVLEFNEQIQLGSGSITFTPATGAVTQITLEAPGATDGVVFNGNTLTVTVGSGLLTTGTAYTVTLDQGAVIDYAVSANSHSGIQSGNYTFSMVDINRPLVESYSPANQAVDTDTDTIVLVFDENIQAGSGNLTLTPSRGAALTIPITDSQITISNQTLTATISNGLLATGITYTVTLDAGAVTDFSSDAGYSTGNPFTGITDGAANTSSYQFVMVDKVGALAYTNQQYGYITYDLNSSFPHNHPAGELSIREGGSHMALELRADYWLTPLTDSCTSQLLTSNGQQTHGWSSLVGQTVASATVTASGSESEVSRMWFEFGALPGYNISATEVVTVSVPAECVASNYNYGEIAELSVTASVCEVSSCKSGTCQELGGYCKCPHGWGGFDCKKQLDCSVNGQCMQTCPSCKNEYVSAVASS